MTGLLRPSKCVKKLIKERIESPRHAHRFVISIARNNKNITVKVSTEKNTNLKKLQTLSLQEVNTGKNRRIYRFRGVTCETTVKFVLFIVNA